MNWPGLDGPLRTGASDALVGRRMIVSRARGLDAWRGPGAFHAQHDRWRIREG